MKSLKYLQYPVGDTLIAARSRPNDDWGSVGNSAKSRRTNSTEVMVVVWVMFDVQYRKLSTSTGSLD